MGHYRACKDIDVKPILGVEVYFQPEFNSTKRSFHLILLVKDVEGYKNLMKMISEANIENFFKNPIVDSSILKRYSKGLICSSACASGLISVLINSKAKRKLIYEIAMYFKKIFNDDFYLEIIPIKYEPQYEINERIIELGKETKIDVVLTFDSHFVAKEDYDSYLMMHKLRGAKLDADYSERFMPSTEEVFELWRQMHPQIDPTEFILNSSKIADKCNVELDFRNMVPKVRLDSGDGIEDSREKIIKIAKERLRREGKTSSKYKERLMYELKVVFSHKFEDYFLLCYDIVDYAKRNRIRVGAGRGCFLPKNKIVKIANSREGTTRKNIENVQINDRILTWDSRYLKVLRKFEYDVIGESCIRLILGNGNTIECTSDHKLLTGDSWKEAGKLTLQDVLVSPLMSKIMECKICGKKKRISMAQILGKHAFKNAGEWICQSCYMGKENKTERGRKKRLKSQLANKSLKSRLKNSNTLKRLMRETDLRKKISDGLNKMYSSEIGEIVRKKISVGGRKALMENPSLVEMRTKHNKNYKQGKFYSEKMKSLIWYGSSYELKALEILELDSEIVAFGRSMELIRYKKDNDKNSCYKPDFFFIKVIGKKYLLEIKPKYMLDDDGVKRKLLAAKEFIKLSNEYSGFIVWTEQELFNKNDFGHENIEIRKIEGFQYTGKVYDLEVEGVHNYCVGNCVAHNSVGGSLLAYALAITDVDPLKLGTSFERFLKKDKKKLPDIDIDFESARRQEVIDYILQKYSGRAAQITTFGYYKVRNLVNDLAKVLEMDNADKVVAKKALEVIVDATGGNLTIEDLNSDRELKQIDKRCPDFLKHFYKMYNQVRFIGRHAAGVAITPKDITNYVALRRIRDNLQTSYDLKGLEEVNVLKMDILGLSTLSVINDVEKMIGKGILFNDNLLDDTKVYDEFCKGNTAGVFQFEKSKAIDLLAKVKPQNIQELIACNSLNRPAPIKLGVADEYIARKNGEIAKERLWYKYTQDTYGTLIYQEQVMAICRNIGDLSWDDTDIVMKSLKKMDKTKMRRKFTKGAVKNGFSEQDAGELFEKMTLYLFNKSHGAAYSIISFYCMYLKIHYPLEFYCALIKNEADDKKLVKYIACAAKSGVVILLPHVNSGVGTRIVSIDGDKAISLCLTFIKGIGKKTAEEISAYKPYKSVDDFKEKVNLGKVNVGVVEKLKEQGALLFDSEIYWKRTIKYNAFLRSRNIVFY